MESLTKRRVSADELGALVGRAFGDLGVVRGQLQRRLLLAVAEPEAEVVLKVAPDPGLRLLTL